MIGKGGGVMDYPALGKRIRCRRRFLHWTQAQLAQNARLSLSFLGQIERGTHAASISTFVRLCNALDVSPEELLFDSLRLSGQSPSLLTPPEREILFKAQQILSGLEKIL